MHTYTEGSHSSIREVRMLSRVAVISLHASPLERAGQSNAGGLNVYVRALALAQARQDLHVDIFTRRTDAATPDVVELGAGVRVIHVDAGPLEPLAPDDLLPFVPLFTAGVVAFAGVGEQPYDLVHSHYWLSGLVALRLRRRWRVPAVHMFHTLAQVKRRVAGIWSPADERRALLEQEVLCGVDAVVVANALEAAQLRELYDTTHTRLHAIPCGVDLALFAPARPRRGPRGAGSAAGRAARLCRGADRAAQRSGHGRPRDRPPGRTGIPDAHLLIAGGPVTGPGGDA